MKLRLEVRGQENKTSYLKGRNSVVLLCPPAGEEYWMFRVKLSDSQSIIGFPKYSGIGIGFAKEEDWNTNLPFGEPSENIWEHIKHNKADKKITKRMGIEAINMIQCAAVGYFLGIGRVKL